jgi:hypothetical protein
VSDSLTDAREAEREARRLLLVTSLNLHWARGHRLVALTALTATVAAIGAAFLAAPLLVISFGTLAYAVYACVALYVEDRRIRGPYAPVRGNRTVRVFPTQAVIRAAIEQQQHAQRVHGRALDALVAAEQIGEAS